MSDSSPTDRPGPSSSWTDAADSPRAEDIGNDPDAPGAVWTDQAPGLAALGPATQVPPARLYVYLLALVGSIGGVLAAIIEEARAGTPLLLGVVIAPAVEEVCKPIAVIFMLEKRPHWLRSRGEVVFLSILGAAVFATLENLLYTHVHHPEGGWDYIAWRYGVCTSMHVVASAVMGYGLARAWQHIQTTGKKFSIEKCLWYYVAAGIIHGVYNGTVTVLELTGVLDF